MLNISLDRKAPTPEHCIKILTEHTNQFGVCLDYDRMLECYIYYQNQSDVIRRELSRYLHVAADDVTDAVMLKWLGDVTPITAGFSRTGKGNRISLSEKSIRLAMSTGQYTKEIETILMKFIDMKKKAHVVSPFLKVINSNSISKLETYDGHRMLVVKPTWTRQNTGRIGAENPGILNFPKDFGDVITVPKGWRYLTVDSGQIEPRIINSYYINDPQIKRCIVIYNDAYFGYIHYCTVLTPEDRASGRLDFQPIEISDEIREKRKKFKTYGNAVMYGSTENAECDRDKDAFIRYIGGNPRRIEWQKRVENKLDRGERIFYTAFGTPIDITNSPKEEEYSEASEQSYFNHLVRNAINNPIQGTAADLMRMSIQEADKLLARETEKSFIMKYTHDSGTFAIHESEFDKVAPILKEITAYQVADWIPIYGDAEFEIAPSKVFPRLI